jgi:Flp pilus assembly pilin Flp
MLDRPRKAQSGATLVEYVLLLALINVVAAGGLVLMGVSLGEYFQAAGAAIEALAVDLSGSGGSNPGSGEPRGSRDPRGRGDPHDDGESGDPHNDGESGDPH